MSTGKFNQKFSRRKLLESLGVASALAPFVPLLNEECYAAGPIKRICFFFTPNGLHEAQLLPTGSDLTFGEMLKPLEPYKQQILLLHGFDLKAMGGNMGADHPIAAPYLMTAGRGSPSIDQFIASRVKLAMPSIRFPSLLLTGPSPSSSPQEVLSYDLNGTKISSLSYSPKSVWSQFFNGLPTGGGAQPDNSAALRLNADRKSVIDNVLSTDFRVAPGCNVSGG